MGDYLRRQPAPEDGGLTVYVIFERPIEFPNGYVVRRQIAVAGGVWIDPIAVGVATLEQARAEVPPGLFNLGRRPGDAPAVLETWI